MTMRSCGGIFWERMPLTLTAKTTLTYREYLARNVNKPFNELLRGSIGTVHLFCTCLNSRLSSKVICSFLIPYSIKLINYNTYLSLSQYFSVFLSIYIGLLFTYFS
jgi:hypothetical protein